MALAEGRQEHLLDQIVDVGLAAEQAQPDPCHVRGVALEQRAVGVGQRLLGRRGAPLDDL